jgi:hypothetical protein
MLGFKPNIPTPDPNLIILKFFAVAVYANVSFSVAAFAFAAKFFLVVATVLSACSFMLLAFFF